MRLHVKYQLLLSEFDQTRISSTHFQKKNPQIPNFMEIRPMGAQLFHEDMQTDGRTDITKLPAALRDFPQTRLTTVTSCLIKISNFASGRLSAAHKMYLAI